MNGPIAQIAALTCHGNAFLADRQGIQFFPGNSTCQFCEKVSFVRFKKSFFLKTSEHEDAGTPDSWFSVIKSLGATGIRLLHKPQNHAWMSDRMSSGLIGGGEIWEAEVLLPDRTSEFWSARWELGNPNAPDKRIWRVIYVCYSRDLTLSSSVPDLSGSARELECALGQIRDFSAKLKMDYFTKCFEDALETISNKGMKRHGYHQDLAPEGFLSGEAAMMLDACQKAWVFGGMGSWNDIWIQDEDKKAYEQVSERLFKAVNSAISDAASSTMKKP